MGHELNLARVEAKAVKFIDGDRLITPIKFSIYDDERRPVDLTGLRITTRSRVLDAENGLVGIDLIVEGPDSGEVLAEICDIRRVK